MRKSGKVRALLIILFVYILALISGFLLLINPASENSIVNVLLADIGATIVVFIFSVFLNNSSVYDPYWSLIPPFIVAWLMYVSPGGNSARQWLIFALILFWAIRLTANWARGWHGMKHEDWRYRKIAADTGKFYWPVSFLGIHLMPTLFVFAGCLPLWYALESPVRLNLFDGLAALVMLFATIIEWGADEQLRKFKRDARPGAVMNKGLWTRMRHPNYFGEILFWAGMFLFVPASGRYDGWWTAGGFIAMIILFNFISIPLMEKRNLSKRPGYEKYMKQVHALLPLKKTELQD